MYRYLILIVVGLVFLLLAYLVTTDPLANVQMTPATGTIVTMGSGPDRVGHVFSVRFQAEDGKTYTAVTSEYNIYPKSLEIGQTVHIAYYFPGKGDYAGAVITDEGFVRGSASPSPYGKYFRILGWIFIIGGVFLIIRAFWV